MNAYAKRTIGHIAAAYSTLCSWHTLENWQRNFYVMNAHTRVCGLVRVVSYR
jgi:hypothetical protein